MHLEHSWGNQRLSAYNNKKSSSKENWMPLKYLLNYIAANCTFC
jgi:hypothetical protein